MIQLVLVGGELAAVWAAAGLATAKVVSATGAATEAGEMAGALRQ